MCLGPITKHGDIDYEAVVKLSDGFNGADLRNVCTEAGLFAIRSYTDRQRDRVLVLPDPQYFTVIFLGMKFFLFYNAVNDA